jgi:Flp pilus assembly protein TadG
MTPPLHPRSRTRGLRGQTLLMFVFVVLALFFFVGLALDLGFAYVTHAQLSKAVDAAALMGVRNLYQGEDTATAVARATFFTNYGTSGRDKATPKVDLGWTDTSTNITISISASSVINTFFLRVLPNWKTMTIKTKAEAVRSKVALMLVLDRSGSMGRSVADGGSDGGKALPDAVSAFITYMVDSLDDVGMTSFGTLATLDVPIGHPFRNKINAAAKAMRFPIDQWTYADGGLQIALSQILSNWPAIKDDSIQKVVLFFTDGFANTSLTNVSGWSATPILIAQDDPIHCPSGVCEIDFCDPSNGICREYRDANLCGYNYSFTSIDGNTKLICTTNKNVWIEGQLRSLSTANLIRQKNITIYSLGLGVEPNINKQFLQELANETNSPTYNPAQPVGAALFAPTPAEMKEVFEAIAERINLRLAM